MLRTNSFSCHTLRIKSHFIQHAGNETKIIPHAVVSYEYHMLRISSYFHATQLREWKSRWNFPPSGGKLHLWRLPMNGKDNATCGRAARFSSSACRLLGIGERERRGNFADLRRQLAPPAFTDTRYRLLGIDEWTSWYNLPPSGGKLHPQLWYRMSAIRLTDYRIRHGISEKASRSALIFLFYILH